MNLFEGIRESSENAKKNHPHRKLFGSIDIFIHDKLPADIDFGKVLSDIERIIPRRFVYGLDVIYIGQFSHLEDREVNSVYMDGAIFITNEQDDERDMVDDLIHEIAHHVETRHSKEIYGDESIKNEFLGKRVRLEKILRFHGYDTSPYNFSSLEYSEEIDKFFHKGVGYDKLDTLGIGLIVSPYSVTSLREYFAIGFEEYHIGSREILQDISPQLFRKIGELYQEGEQQ